MFRITRLSNGQQRDFQNREELEFYLEGEENRCLQLNTTETFHLFHLDKNEELLESMELTIPSSGEKEVKELLGEFGLKKDKKFFWSRGTKQEKAQRVPKKKQELSKAKKSMSNPTPSSTTHNSSNRFWVMIALLFSIFSLAISLTNHYNNKVEDKPQAEKTTINQGADVFCRYFISNYFANSTAREDFISNSLDLSQFDTDKATTVSVLLEKEIADKKVTTLTYVINCRYDDDSTANKRLTLTVKQNKEAKYGYLVSKAPKLTAYP
ncbi:hypothetical protein [Streptococcus sp.]|uniref:hypothetical protein n=1 Tax=Streptococcus sp. TaxID=1306 RepID=UPI0017E38327|nr:hypothetical protein [Streptococcus sp.]HHU64904.1 hypothetical protein [Streptococcus sp.]